MSENPEDDDFEGEDLDEPGEDSADVDLDRVMKDLDLSRKRGQKAAGEPSWRRLERLREDRLTAELTSDFDDYDLGDGAPRLRRGAKPPP